MKKDKHIGAISLITDLINRLSDEDRNRKNNMVFTVSAKWHKGFSEKLKGAFTKEVQLKNNVGGLVEFKYKGDRLVRGVIYNVSKSFFVVTLKSDYIGKNESWFKGEQKEFSIKEAKNIRLL